jgi:hypothetical protein
MIKEQRKQQGNGGKVPLTLAYCKKWLVAGMIVGFVAAFSEILVRDETEYAKLLTYSLVGGLAGYLLFTVQTIVKALFQGLRMVGPAVEHDKAKLQIITSMECIRDSFQYEEFERQLVSRLAVLLTCDDLQQLPWCSQKVREKALEKIVQAEYEGYVRFFGHHLGEESCRMELGVFMRDTYLRGKRSFCRRDLVRINVICDREGEMTVENFWKE